MEDQKKKITPMKKLANKTINDAIQYYFDNVRQLVQLRLQASKEQIVSFSSEKKKLQREIARILHHIRSNLLSGIEFEKFVGDLKLGSKGLKESVESDINFGELTSQSTNEDKKVEK